MRAIGRLEQQRINLNGNRCVGRIHVARERHTDFPLKHASEQQILCGDGCWLGDGKSYRIVLGWLGKQTERRFIL